MTLPDRDVVAGWVGRTFEDSAGDPVGRCTAVFVDDATGAPEWAVVDTPGGSDVRFLPLVGAHEDAGTVRVAFSAEFVNSAPQVGGREHLTEDEEALLYRHYGVPYSDADSESLLPASEVDEQPPVEQPSAVPPAPPEMSAVPEVSEAPAGESPVTAALAVEVPAEEAAAEGAFTEELSPVEMPAAAAPPAEEAPTQEAPTQEAPTDEAPAEEAPTSATESRTTFAEPPQARPSETMPSHGGRLPETVQSGGLPGSPATRIAGGVLGAASVAAALLWRARRQRARRRPALVKGVRQAGAVLGGAAGAVAGVADATAGEFARAGDRIGEVTTRTAAESLRATADAAGAARSAVVGSARRVRRIGRRTATGMTALTGTGTGYLLGARAGQARYAQLRRVAGRLRKP